MKTREIFLKIGIPLLALYCAAYGIARHSGQLTRIQGKGTHSGTQILAKTDSWDQLAIEMGRNSKSTPLKILSEIGQSKTPVLNGVFWVPRKLESAFWNVADIEGRKNSDSIR
jgi:hypothetical protein